MRVFDRLRRSGAAGLFALAAAAVAQAAETGAEAPSPAASMAAPRALRPALPPMDNLPAPTVPEVFSGYPGAAAYSVVPRKPELPLYPCSMCHNLQKLNTTVRQFRVAPPPDGAPHAGVLRHGKGRMWCLDCHYAKDREWLQTLNGNKIDFDDSPRVCGQCHSARYRDWVFGGHGKRVNGWAGERRLYACTHCHDPHVPVFAPQQARRPPPVRVGLQPMAVAREQPPMPWTPRTEGRAREPQAQQ